MRSLRMMGSAIAVVAGLALTGVPAHADSITYTDGGNVWVASPDGAVKKKLTDNASGDIKYFGPSQADNGRIAVIFGGLRKGLATMQTLDASGKLEKSGLLQMSTCGLWGQYPTSFGHTRINPAGDVIAYDYMCTNTDAGGGTTLSTALATVNSLGVMLDPLQVEGGYLPSWLSRKGGDFNDMIGTSGRGQYLSSLTWKVPPSWDPVLELTDPQRTFGGASFSRTGNILTYEISDYPESGPEAHRIYAARLDRDFAPGAGVVAECLVAESSVETMLPSVSPDGRRVTYDDEGGVKVTTFTVPDGFDQPCGGSTITIAPGGVDPVYNAAAAPNNNNGGGGGLKVKGPSKATKAQVRKGLKFSTTCADKCTVKASMKAGSKTVARDTVKLKRKGTAKLKLRAKLKKSVKSVTVLITNGKQSATRTIPISG